MKPSENNRVNANRLLSVLGSRRTPLSGRARIQLQHAAWADGICAKFMSRKPASAHPEALIFLRLAQARLRWLRQRQIVERLYSPITAILNQQVSVTTMTLQAAFKTQDRFAPAALARPAQWVPQSNTLLRGLTTHSDDAATETANARNPRPWLRLQGGAAQFTRALPSPAKNRADDFTPVVRLLRRSNADPAMPAEEQTSEGSFFPLVTRIVRQLRRVETNAVAMTAAREIKYTAMPSADDAVTAPAIHRKRQIEVEESMPARNQAPAPPAINISQITENVLQQLDRRLVAARERMGRI